MMTTRKINWTIRKFTKARIEAMDYEIHTDDIHLNLEEEFKTIWKLTLGKENESFNLFLHKKSSNADNFRVHLTLKCGQFNDAFTKEATDYKAGYGWRIFLSMEEAMQVANSPDKCLKIEMSLSLLRNPIVPQVNREVPKAAPDDYKFFNNKAYSDCAFLCSDGVQVPVHRVILTKRSPGFKILFDAMTRNKTSSRKFDNIDSDTMKAVMSFIYTGNVMLNDDKLSAKVLRAATEFKLMELKKLCADVLIHHLDAQNVLSLLELATDNEAALLEDKCLTFIISHFGQIKGTEEWIALNCALKDKVINTLTGYAPVLTFESELVMLN